MDKSAVATRSKDPGVRRGLLDLTLQYLKPTVTALERGNSPPFAFDPWTGRRLLFHFSRESPLADGSLLAFSDDLDLCDAYRARLLRLLRPPQMWYYIPNIIAQCKHRFSKRPNTVALPYDMIAELEAYDREVQETYPWVSECPYSAVGIPFQRPVLTILPEQD